MPGSDIYSFKGLHSKVALRGCEDLHPILSTVLRDWPMQNAGSDNGNQPIISLHKTSNHYERRSPWLSKPARFRDPVDTVCDLIVDLIHAYVAEQENTLCLHCAAVAFDGGLVVFPSTYRSGKSLLSVKLAASGIPLYSDDVLPIRAVDNCGTALGILPRLRRPLPETAGQALRTYISQRIGPQNAYYRYVLLDRATLAPRGSAAPVTAITLLRRGSGETPALRTTSQSEVVRDMILRNFARQEPAIEIVDRLHAIAEKAACYILTYDTLDQAAGLLKEAFGLPREGIKHDAHS